MLAAIISSVIISLSVISIGAMYSANIANAVNKEGANKTEIFINEQNILLDGASFYCKSNPGSCVSATSSVVELPISEVMKYTPLKEIKTFGVANIDRVYVDMNTNQIKLDMTFLSDQEKQKYFSHYKSQSVAKECVSGSGTCLTSEVLALKPFDYSLQQTLTNERNTLLGLSGSLQTGDTIAQCISTCRSTCMIPQSMNSYEVASVSKGFRGKCFKECKESCKPSEYKYRYKDRHEHRHSGHKERS